MFRRLRRAPSGHDDYFRQAKEHGDELFVVVARDVTVVDVKGNLPSMNEDARLEAVLDHPLVDDARLGYPAISTRSLKR